MLQNGGRGRVSAAPAGSDVNRSRRMLHWPSMRILAVIVVAIFSILSVGCTADGVMLQPPVQGEWQNFHNDKKQISKDAREEAQQPPAEK